MIENRRIILYFILITTTTTLCADRKHWSFEMLEVSSSSSNPDICELNFEIVRISRGKYAMDGFLDIKIDVDDNTLIEGSLYRSNTVGNNFQKLPMEIANETLTVTMNEFYKKFVMNDIQECATNVLYFEDKFVAPLTKRYVDIKSCTVSTDNLPSHMSEGVYKLLLKVHGPAEVKFEVLFRIETESVF